MSGEPAPQVEPTQVAPTAPTVEAQALPTPLTEPKISSTPNRNKRDRDDSPSDGENKRNRPDEGLSGRHPMGSYEGQQNIFDPSDRIDNFSINRLDTSNSIGRTPINKGLKTDKPADLPVLNFDSTSDDSQNETVKNTVVDSNTEKDPPPEPREELREIPTTSARSISDSAKISSMEVDEQLAEMEKRAKQTLEEMGVIDEVRINIENVEFLFPK